MRHYSIVIPPTIEPVSVDEARAYLKISVDDPAQDTLLAMMIKAARRAVENYTRLALAEQTVNFVTDEHLKSNWISAPLASVTTILAAFGVDQYGNESTLDESKINLVDGDVPCRYFVLNGALNTNYAQLRISHVVNCVTEIPDALKIGVLRQVAWLYDHRDDLSLDRETVLERGVRELLEPYRWVSL